MKSNYSTKSTTQKKISCSKTEKNKKKKDDFQISLSATSEISIRETNNHYFHRGLLKFASFMIAIMIGFSSLHNVFGNSVAISALAVTQNATTGGTVGFNIAWNNSWRDIVNPPYNWDAIWLFVKFRACADGVTVAFTHGTVSTVLGDHTFPATLEPTTRDGLTIPGIDAAANNTGVMLRRTTDGTGDIAAAAVIIKVDNLPDNTIPIDTRVFALEMVYITGGAVGGVHFLGDGSGAAQSTGSVSTTQVSLLGVTIPSEAAITVWDAAGIGNNRLMTANFQKGYAPFYMMKYEISQGAYTDFLNTISNAQSVTRYPGSFGVNRHTINNTGVAPQVYTCTRPDRACNVLSWADESAYLDWAALRPLTEVEYEKAGRGFLGKTYGEYAWATTAATNAAAAGISGAEDGTETITTANANVHGCNCTFTTGDLQLGPLRTGIFAKAGTTTRLETGASYFGVMEMTGNVEEYYIAIYAGIAGQVSNGGVLLGNGALSAAGNHDVASWPAYNTVVGGAATNILLRKGGSVNAIRTLSYRNNTSSVDRDAYAGGRGGR